MRQSRAGAGIARGVAEGFSEEVTLEMKWRGMRRENVLGRGQQVQRPGAQKGLGGFKEEQGGAVRLECGQPWGARMETGQAGLTGCSRWGHRAGQDLATENNKIRALFPFSKCLTTLLKVTQLVSGQAETPAPNVTSKPPCFLCSTH